MASYTDTRSEPDDYWKVFWPPGARSKKDFRQELQRRRIDMSNSARWDDLNMALKRTLLGLSLHKSTSHVELRKIIRERGIEMEPYASPLKSLFKADEERKFDKLLDLPPELRNRIYQYHFASFYQPIYAAEQPPISKISRQLRKETLGLFYSSCTFRFAMEAIRPRGRRFKMDAVSMRQLMFLRCTPAEHLACIKKFVISKLHNNTMDHARFRKGYTITVADDDEECKVLGDTSNRAGQEMANALWEILLAWRKDGKRALSSGGVLDMIIATIQYFE